MRATIYTCTVQSGKQLSLSDYRPTYYGYQIQIRLAV